MSAERAPEGSALVPDGALGGRLARLSTSAFVFLGAVLLFTLEPLASRMLLPRFGGSFHVWTTALMFFQGALFAGYVYAHGLAERLGRWHLLVVALPLLFMPVTVGEADPGAADVGGILVALARHVAVPFVVLSTTAVVAQRWWASAGREPYGLYAVSNAGSLGALLAYALIVEPFVGLGAQRWAWMALYVAYAILAAIAWRADGAAVRRREPARAARPAAGTLLYWTMLSAAPSAFSMAVTNLIALEAGSVPLVWVVPLAIYLGSFVVAFAARGEDETRVPRLVRRLWPHVALVGLFFYSGGETSGWLAVLVHLVVLAFVSLAAHGELHRARPPAAQLTLYYLVVAMGGWLGGAFVALLAPVAFTGLYEYPAAVVAVAITIGVGRRALLLEWLKRGPRLALLATAALVLVVVAKVGHGHLTGEAVEMLDRRRSFYGLYSVVRTEAERGAMRELVSGATRHGRQREGDLAPLSYYHREGPLGDALGLLGRPREIGVVGLGVGAAAAHLERGERIRFFEIDPVVVELARERFTYLAGARAAVEIVVGDARVALERESARSARRYDLLLVDAFAGDAIPTHLLTIEAVRLYVSRVEEDGIVLVHVSNRYYDVRSVLAANARALGLAGVQIERTTDLSDGEDPSAYVALARRAARLAPLVEAHGWRALAPSPAVGAWTDDHVNVLAALTAKL